MSPSEAIVAVHRMPAEVETRVREACARAGARTITSDAAAGVRPSILVAHLPRRARRIPPEVIELANRTSGELPLILACDEALVHPATSLRMGGVTLVHHAESERLYSQIRIALAASRDVATPEAAPEHAGPYWWLAAIGHGDPLAIACDGAISAVVPLRPGVDAPRRLAAAHAIAVAHEGREAEGSAITSSLVECLGSDAGLVHLAPEARAWVLYWPAGAGGLWLYSSHRLPHLSELSRASDVPRILRSPASPGEIVLATTRALDPSEAHVAQTLEDGGPATLDRLRALARPIDGSILEVR